MATVVQAVRMALHVGESQLGVTDIFGDVVEGIRAPHAGPVVRITTFPIVSSSERVVQLGVPR